MTIVQDARPNTQGHFYIMSVQRTNKRLFEEDSSVVSRRSPLFHWTSTMILPCFLPNCTGRPTRGTRFVNGRPVRVGSRDAYSALNAISQIKPLRFSAENRRFRVWNSPFLLPFTPLWTFPSFNMMSIFCTCEIPSLSVRLVP